MAKQGEPVCIRKTGDSMEYDNLKRCVERAIKLIYTREAYLITHSLSEWTLSAQFHYYMRKECQKFLKGFSFDSEYNFMAKITDKGLAQKYICVNGELLRVRPDLIIHKRDNQTGNFLWVEMKRREGKGWKNDLNRVKAVTRASVNENGLGYVTGYTYGLGVLLHKRSVLCKWFVDGNEHGGRIMSKDRSGAWKWSDAPVDVCGCLSL